MSTSKFVRLRVVGVIVAAAIAAPAFSGAAVASSTSTSPSARPIITTGTLEYLGTSTLSARMAHRAAAPAGAPGPYEYGPKTPQEHSIAPSNRSVSTSNGIPKPASNGITSANPNMLTGFMGLTHKISRSGTDLGNNQFSLEPPDQCNVAQGSFDLEGVNNALAVYRTDTHALVAGPMALNSFWKFPPGITRSTPPVFGPFVGDINCLYDVGTHRYFLTAFDLEQDPQTGAETGGGGTLIAVSTGDSPVGTYRLYKLDTTGTADGAAEHRTCPCFGDQPRIGTDANGFYVSVNAFSDFNFPGQPTYFGGEVYALSKRMMESYNGSQSQSLPRYVRYSNLLSLPYIALNHYPLIYNASIEPAMSEGSYDTGHGGTEYFLSSNDYGFCLDNRITAWAMTNTSLLDSNGFPSLTAQYVQTDPYGCAPPANQKPGTQPYGKSQKNPHIPERLNVDDERMEQAVFAAGHVWGALTTRVIAPNGTERAGIEWFRVNPTWNSDNTFAPSLVRDGYIVANNENVLYPAIAANNAGRAAISFTMSGTNNYPSAAYAVYNPVSRQFGTVHISAAGNAPEDGFTGYDPVQGVCVDAEGNQYFPCARWGDYSAANVDVSTGTIWIATEYIPGAPGQIRTPLANWGTFITQVDPSISDIP